MQRHHGFDHVRGDSMTSRKVLTATRRSLLRGAASGALGVAAVGWIENQTALAQKTPAASPVAPPSPAVELPQPKSLKSVDGELNVTLTAMFGVVDMGAPKPVTTYTYDGVVPGYTWDVLPGDTLKIDLVNNLPALTGPMTMTRPHMWTTTNLHTHGLHVSPSGNADNVFLEIAPGASQHYEISIPINHTGGMFWYHPHKHGAVCQQVRAGMAGALIVRGEIDQVPEIAAAKEQVIVLQAIELGDDYQLLDPIPDPTTEQAFFPRTQILYTVNGVVNPKITMHPGEVQRWRLLNAAEGKFMSLELSGHTLNVLAWDGLTMAAPDVVKGVTLSAGNRVDLLVKAGAAGSYDFILSPGSSQHPETLAMFNGGMEADSMGTTNKELVTRPILTLEVVGEGPEMALPVSLPAYDPPMPEIARQRQFSFSVERQADGEFIDFGISGFPFDPNRAPYQIKLGAAEEWTLINAVDNKLPMHAHGFHIHVNPFKVTAINGELLDVPQWRDTFALTGMTSDSFTFQIHFEDFTGKFVDHCHVLAHEDLGMMEALEVVP
jgi:FtsP/CotA-like multicopper oxidase with cupredoxin domain